MGKDIFKGHLVLFFRNVARGGAPHLIGPFEVNCVPQNTWDGTEIGSASVFFDIFGFLGAGVHEMGLKSVPFRVWAFSFVPAAGPNSGPFHGNFNEFLHVATQVMCRSIFFSISNRFPGWNYAPKVHSDGSSCPHPIAFLFWLRVVYLLETFYLRLSGVLSCMS